MQYIGEFVLNRNVDEFFAETEQVAFCTSHVIPGVGFSDDPLLQGRNFSYFDTQISRLGINWEELPINRPICPVMNFNRGGKMKHRIHQGKVNYWPNRFSEVPPCPMTQGGYVDYAEKVSGIKARTNGPKFQEHFNQARMFYNSLSEVEKLHVQSALAFELDHCDEPIVYERVCQRLYDLNPDLAANVSRMVGGGPPLEGSSAVPPVSRIASARITPPKAKAISMFEFHPSTPTIVTRKIGILIADGFDSLAVENVKASIVAAGAVPLIIGPRRHNILPAGAEPGSSSAMKADHHFEGMRSTMVDAVMIPPGTESINTLRTNGRVTHWIREAFGHLKPIGALGYDAVELLKDVLGPEVTDRMEFASMDVKVVSSYGVVTMSAYTGDEGNDWWRMWKIVKDEFNFVSAYFYEISQHRNWKRELEGLAKLVAF